MREGAAPGGRIAVVIAGLAAVVLPAPGPVAASPEDQPVGLVDQHLSERVDALARQGEAARQLARQHAWTSYRLARRRSLGFLANPAGRREDARAAGLSLQLLDRSLDESRKIATELAIAETERRALRHPPDGDSGARPAEGADVAGPPGSEDHAPRPPWPVKGTIVVAPGPRTDAMTGVEFRQSGVEILARIDAAVRSPRGGRVHRVEPLLEGGYAVVIRHDGDLVTILTGLRQVKVAAGDPIAAGAEIGLVGRTLDGAPVLGVAIYRGSRAQDPREVFAR